MGLTRAIFYCYNRAMKSPYLFVAAGILVILSVAGYLIFRPSNPSGAVTLGQSLPEKGGSALETVTLSGTYTCLPLLSDAKSADCAFGLKTDDGSYYAVNFGAAAGSMADFKSGAHITAKGFVIKREDLNPNNWEKFIMKGLFTITEHPTL